MSAKQTKKPTNRLPNKRHLLIIITAKVVAGSEAYNIGIYVRLVTWNYSLHCLVTKLHSTPLKTRKSQPRHGTTDKCILIINWHSQEGNKSMPTILPQRKYLLTKMAVVNSSLWKQLLHGLIQTCIPAPTVSVSKPNQSTPISTNPSYTKFWLHPVKPTQERLNSELCMCTCIQHII